MAEEQVHGTKLASHASSLSSLRYDAVRSRLLKSNVSRFMRPRLGLQLPSLLFTIGTLIYVDYPLGPLIGALSAAGIAILAMIASVVTVKVLGFNDRRFYLAQLTLFLSTYLMTLSTGGFFSPVFFVFVIMGSLADLPHVKRPRVPFWAITLAGIALLFVWPKAWLGPQLGPQPYFWVIGVAASTLSVTVSMGLAAWARAGIEAGQRLERLREDVLAETTGRARTLESISSRVAHELKNPLASIKGMAQLLERGTDDERTKTRLGVIVEEATRMEVILSDYLSFTRPLEDLQPQRFDVRALLLDVIAIIEPRAEAARVKILFRDEPRAIVADPRRIKEAMLNLLSNAIESTLPGGSVFVELGGAEEGATIIVRDTGKGMAPETLDKLGTPFFTTREGGTGLGVVLTRAAITQHGGDVRYESKVGEGTTVTVRLPPEPKQETHGPRPHHR